MTQQEIFDLLDKKVKTNKRIAIGLLIGSILFFIPGIPMIFIYTGDNQVGGFFLSTIGAIMLIVSLSMTLPKTLEKNVEKFKAGMNGNPKEFVWVYIHNRKKNNMVISTDVMVNFTERKTLRISSVSLPGRNVDGFINAIVKVNPQVVLGYTPELAKKFRSGDM